MNLAFIGFFVTGAAFTAYAYTFYNLAEKSLPVYLKNYSFAYFSLALSFFIWSIAVLVPSFLENSVIIGNALILLGSLFLLNILLNKNKKVLFISIIIWLIFSFLFIWFRIIYFFPTPYLDNGVLVFNTQTIITIILNLIFALVWLPANIIAAKKVTADIKIEGITYAYTFIYIVSTLAAILFLTFKTVPMIIFSFITLSICFIMLLYSNIVISKLLPKKV